jgi:hypothetical protein
VDVAFRKAGWSPHCSVTSTSLRWTACSSGRTIYISRQSEFSAAMNHDSASSLRCLSKKETALLELIHALLGSTNRSRRGARLIVSSFFLIAVFNFGAVVAECEARTCHRPVRAR